MNFSMVPPCRSTIARAVSKYRDSSSRTSSGSRCLGEACVNPTRSANSTDTIRRSAAGSIRGAGGPSIGDPQAPQYRSSGSLAVPHAGHRASSGVPQLPQNRRPARFSAPQELHTMRRSVLHDEMTVPRLPVIVALLAASCGPSVGVPGGGGGSAPSAPRFAVGVQPVTAASLGRSWHPGCPVSPDGLRLVSASAWGFGAA